MTHFLCKKTQLFSHRDKIFHVTIQTETDETREVTRHLSSWSDRNKFPHRDKILHITTGIEETGDHPRQNRNWWNGRGHMTPVISVLYLFLSHRDKILHITTSIEETGDVQWQLLLCNLAVFAIVFLVLLKGIQSLGKVNILTLSHLPKQIVGWCITSLLPRMHWHCPLRLYRYSWRIQFTGKVRSITLCASVYSGN